MVGQAAPLTDEGRKDREWKEGREAATGKKDRVWDRGE